MRRIVEGAGFVALAVGAHMLMVGMAPPEAGSSSAGEGGTAVMTLAAATESIESMVEDWDTPPELELDIAELTPPAPITPPTPSIVPDVTTPEAPILETPALQFETPVLNDAFSVPTTPPPPTPPKPEPKPQPNPKPSVASNASAAQKAAGSGGQTSAGKAGSSATSSQAAAKAQSELARWHSAIRARIERRKKSVRAVGTVRVQISVGRDGRLQSAKIVGPSGDSKIDTAAMRAVSAAGRFPKAPKSATQGQYTIEFAMRYK